MIDSNNFNTDIILNEIDLVIKKGVNKILNDYMNRYNLLERTHKQIMQLPSVLNELNKSSDKLSVDDSSDDESDDVPIFVSIADMTKNLVTEEVNAIEKKIANLEKKYDLILPIFEKILKKIDDLNADVKCIKSSSTSEVKVIKYNNKTVETKENIKLEMHEEEPADERLSDKKKEEASDNNEVVKESVDEESVDEESVDEESVDEEAVNEEEPVEDEDDKDDKDDKDDNDEVETEDEEDDKKNEEDEELFEIEIDGTTYCTNNEESGLIFELTEDGDVGEKIGYLKEGEPFFYADEK
jgi:hypothetical protein